MGLGESQLLVIDDEDIVRETIVAYLEDSGFKVYEASNGSQGLELFHQHHPDLVLCDLKMPKMDGFAVLKEIKADPSGTPIIVISGVGVMGDVVEALRFGASDYLIKPILDMEVLEHSISRVLEQGKLKRENTNYRQQLERANLELKQNLKVLEQDQQAGRHVQFKMLPPTPKQFTDYHFSHKVVPSLYLSGDFVDYFTVGDNHVAFFMADVSGHGASSAFVTVLLKNLFARKRSDFLHLNDQAVLSPSAMLHSANQELLNTDIGKHVTMCVGVIDMSANSLCFSVAGHLPLPILATPSKCDYLSGKGMPVGIFENASYTEKIEPLPDSFVLTLFSDGVLEVLSTEGVLAQERHLLDKLKSGLSSINEIAKALDLEGVVDAPDDIAVLLISKGNIENEVGTGNY
jgi:phosphoserine phosphatase RsbU/P